MFVDASALTAILTGEHDASALLARLDSHEIRSTSPLAVWETAIAVSRNLGLTIDESRTAVEDFLALADIRLEAVPAEAAGVALAAFDRYGKGRHRAALNFGDCFAYACARLSHVPMLYKGDDFPLTDIEPA